jgi:hypothetical protein
VIFIWGDAIFCKHTYADIGQSNQRNARIQLFKQSFIPIIAIFCYLIWSITAYQFNHTFPYAFQNRLKDQIGYDILIYFGEAVLMWVMFWLGYYINKRVHRAETENSAEKESINFADEHFEHSEAPQGVQRNNPV